jgi:Ca-activated chloride channel family protein
MIAEALELYGYTLLDPWLLLFAPVFVAIAVRCRLRQPAALPAAQTGMLQGLPRTLRARCVHLPLWITLLGGVCLALALARPVRREVVPQRQEGIDIALVLDLSSSMNIQDTADRERPRRIDAARERAMEFAKERKNDRVAYVAFSRYAELRCPPTLDEAALAAFLMSTDTVPENSELDGTAIGVAIAKAVQTLERSDAKSRVVVLLSDGETTVRTIEVEDAVKLASDAKVRIHTIGLGQGMPTPFGGFRALEFSDLKLAAQKTGGRFFQPKTDRDLAEVYVQIDELEKSKLEDPRYRFVDGFEWPLGIGLSCCLLALLLEVFWLWGAP